MMEAHLPYIIDDILWLDTIVEKLAWKHGVLPHEVEEVLTADAGYSITREAR